MALCSDFSLLDDWLVVESAANGLEHELKGLSLLSEDGNRSLPLQSRKVTVVADCVSGAAEVREDLIFLSNHDCSAILTYPVPSRSAVTSLEARIGDKTVHSVTKPKAAAEREFREAVSQGHTAVQLQETSTARLLKLSLGNLAAGSGCVVIIKYVQLLDTLGSLLELTHQATWVPPYHSATDQGQEQQLAFSNQPAYSLTYQVHVEHDPGYPPRDVTSSTHQLIKEPSAANELRFTIPQQQVSESGKDLQLAVEMPDRQTSGIQLQKSQGKDDPHPTLLASFTSPERDRLSEGKRKRELEVLLVTDCSGSMGGAPISDAREAAKMFIRDLPFDQGIHFNIIIFGSHHQFMWEAAQAYSSDTEQHALQWIDQRMHANLGGTEILATLQSIYTRQLAPGWERKVVFLTDGGISESQTDSVLQMVSPEAATAQGQNQNPYAGSWASLDATTPRRMRIFSLGIGHGVHRPLLDGLARRSGGATQYILGSTRSNEIARKVSWLARAALARGALHKPRLLCRSCLLSISPAKLPDIILPGSSLTVLATVNQAAEGAILEMVCEDANGEPVSVALSLPATATSKGSSYSTLHAMSTISELMQGTSRLHLDPSGQPLKAQPSSDEVKEEVTRLACAEGLVTPYTSRVGVLLLHDPLDPGKVQQHEVPIQVPAGRPLFQAAPSTHRGFGNARVRSGSASQQSYNGAGACSASGISSWPGIGGGQRRGPQAARRVGTALFRAAPASCVAPSPWAAATFGASKQNQPFAFSGNPSTYASESTQSSARGFGSLDQQEASLSASQKVAAAEHIASMRAGAAASPVPAASSSPADETPIAQLSRIRETEGFWEPSVELAKLLISKRLGANEPGQGAIFAHSELPPRVWATVLVLAWLHKHAQPDRGLWTSMWDKAFSWLQDALRQGGSSSPEKTIMSARKEV